MKDTIINPTESLCPLCLNNLKAEVLEKKGKILLKKTCPSHGTFEDVHVLNYPPMYRLMKGLHSKNKGDYIPEGLKIYVTRRCDMRCDFCFERAGEWDLKEPMLEEIDEWISKFKGSSIYLQGGEPTVREDLEEIIKLIKKRGFYAVLFTNGKRLSDIDYAKRLKDAGLDYAIVSLDSLERGRNIEIHNEDVLDSKLKAIENMQNCGVYVGIFMKLVKRLNEDEIPAMISFCSENSHIKTLFLSSVWKSGRVKNPEQVLFEEVFRRIEDGAGIEFETTQKCSAFAHNLFEILQKLGLHRGHKEPMCSTNTYLVRSNSGFIPLDCLIDIEKVNTKLEKISDLLKEPKNINKALAIARLNGVLVISLLNRDLIRVLMKSFRRNFKNFISGRRLSFMFLDVFSIVVGVFHNGYNIDLDATKTCNMYAVIPETGEFVPQCVRQMMIEKEFRERK